MKKFPATLIGLIHTTDDIERVLPVLLKICSQAKKRNTLFLEHRKADVDMYLKKPYYGGLSGYGHIVDIALGNGMEIMPLDSSGKRGELVKVKNRLTSSGQMREIWKAHQDEAEKIGINMDSFINISRYYGMYTLRERRWLIHLRKARPGDIVVMHPNHALHIANKLGIPYKKVLWLNEPTANLGLSSRYLTPENLRKARQFRKAMRQKRIKRITPH